MLTSRWDTKGYERRKSRCINKRLLPRCLFTLRFSRLMIHAYVFLTCFVHYIYSNAIELRSPRKLSGLSRNYSYFNRFILSNFYQTENSSTTNSQNHFHYSIILALFSVEVSTNSNSPILLFLHSFIYLFLSFPLSTWLNKRFSKFPSPDVLPSRLLEKEGKERFSWSWRNEMTVGWRGKRAGREDGG